MKKIKKIIEAMERSKQILINDGETVFDDARRRVRVEIANILREALGKSSDFDYLPEDCVDYIYNVIDEWDIRISITYRDDNPLSITLDYVGHAEPFAVDTVDEFIDAVNKCVKEMPALALLNTSIITAPGNYTMKPITLEKARELVENAYSLDSAIGHESTAQIMSELLGVDVPVNRQMFEQKSGQKALVFKLNGRPPEGKILSREEVEKIGYHFQLMIRNN